ncbi:hypothetical protein [Nannocystis sp. SCPEA4]|uniref:hypothetical protein n=1 Tax=Nannocystis sp. SCPEA4 TaxID=2996787 RepID=UPI00227226DC|nr:hypothetical protein [Nannocystis sp. SCPEA4]MCY1059002.1 hypothetical protein [Nannocystis sp. SCPEA4]
MAESGTQTIVEAFALHRWRLRSGEEIERETAEATRLLAGDETERARGVARLTDALRYAPYHLAIHDALAAHAATVGDSDAGFRHLAARVEATGEVPGPRSPALAAWPAKRRASLVAPLAALRPDRGRDLHVEEIAPVRASCGILRWTADRTDAVRLAYRRFLESGRPSDVEACLDKLGESPFVLDDETVGDYRYPALLELFRDLAPHVEPLRLLVDVERGWIDEVWVVGAAAYVVRHPAAWNTSHPALRVALAVPDDQALSAFVRDRWCETAQEHLDHHEEDQRSRADFVKRFGSERVEPYGPIAELVHDLDPPAGVARNLLAAAHAIDRAERAGGDVAELRRQLDARSDRLAGQTPASLARFDAIAAQAESLLASGDFTQALEIVDALIDIEPPWYEGSSLLRGLALDGMGRTRLAQAAYAHHVARRIGEPYTLLTDAGRLVRDRCLAGAEFVFRALFGAPLFYGVAARNGAAECRLLAGDVAGARELYTAAIAAATVARSRTRKPSSTASEIDNQAAIARRALAELGA